MTTAEEKESTPEEITKNKEKEEKEENQEKEKEKEEEPYEILREDFPNYDLSVKIIVIGNSGNLKKNFII